MQIFLILLAIIIFLVLVSVILVCFIVILNRRNKTIKDELATMIKVIEEKEKNLAVLVDHSQADLKIKKTIKKIKNKIREAKSDQEVNEVIECIIDLNNSKLHND